MVMRYILVLHMMHGMKVLKIITTISIKFLSKASESLCSEQHFCSCPPFLRHPSTSMETNLHFSKHTYADQ